MANLVEKELKILEKVKLREADNENRGNYEF
jgi:hypothetical protein